MINQDICAQRSAWQCGEDRASEKRICCPEACYLVVISGICLIVAKQKKTEQNKANQNLATRLGNKGIILVHSMDFSLSWQGRHSYRNLMELVPLNLQRISGETQRFTLSSQLTLFFLLNPRPQPIAWWQHLEDFSPLFTWSKKKKKSFLNIFHHLSSTWI